MNPVIASLISVAGVIIGAMMQFYFGRQTENRKLLKNQTAQAYIDYIKAISQIAKTPSNKDSLLLLTDAKTRICIYGSKKVLESLYALEEAGAHLGSQEGENAMANLLKSMRSDFGNASDDTSKDHIKRIVFRKQPP